jgi:hypothetical protein
MLSNACDIVVLHIQIASTDIYCHGSPDQLITFSGYRCYAKFKFIERADEGLDVVELLSGLYELCSKTPPQIITFIFDMYATPG